MKVIILKPDKKYYVTLFQRMTHKLGCGRIWDLLFIAHPEFYFKNILSFAL